MVRAVFFCELTLGRTYLTLFLGVLGRNDIPDFIDDTNDDEEVDDEDMTSVSLNAKLRSVTGIFDVAIFVLFDRPLLLK